MKKKLLSCLFASIVMTSCVNDAVVPDNQEKKDGTEISGIEKSMGIYSDLMNSFKSEKTRGAGEEEVYPEYYGGGYINDDGLLVIWVKKGFELPKTLNEESSVIVQEGQFSYRELKQVMRTIDKFKGQSLLTPVSANLCMWALDDKNNRVEVYLKDCSSVAIEEFKNVVCDSPSIVFKKKEGVTEDWNRVDIIYTDLFTRAAINISAGTYIYAAPEGSTTAKPGSFGYKAKKNGVEGFVTAGHVAANGDLISKANNDGTAYLMGKCTVSEHTNNGDLDAAFCVLTSSSFAITNQIGNTGKAHSQYLYRNYAVGTSVYLCGGKTSSTGKITSLDVSSSDDNTGVIIKGLVKADYASTGGDSGGLVYMTLSGNNYILGVHHGGTHSGTTHVTTFCPASKIQDNMGILPSI